MEVVLLETRRRFDLDHFESDAQAPSFEHGFEVITQRGEKVFRYRLPSRQVPTMADSRHQVNVGIVRMTIGNQIAIAAFAPDPNSAEREHAARDRAVA